MQARKRQATQARQLHITTPHLKSGTRTTTNSTGILLCLLVPDFRWGDAMCIFLFWVACRFCAFSQIGESNSLRFTNSYALLPPTELKARNRQTTKARKLHIAPPHLKSGTRTTTNFTGILLCLLVPDFRWGIVMCNYLGCVACRFRACTDIGGSSA